MILTAQKGCDTNLDVCGGWACASIVRVWHSINKGFWNEWYYKWAVEIGSMTRKKLAKVCGMDFVDCLELAPGPPTKAFPIFNKKHQKKIFALCKKNQEYDELTGKRLIIKGGWLVFGGCFVVNHCIVGLRGMPPIWQTNLGWIKKLIVATTRPWIRVDPKRGCVVCGLSSKISTSWIRCLWFYRGHSRRFCCTSRAKGTNEGFNLWAKCRIFQHIQKFASFWIMFDCFLTALANGIPTSNLIG